MNQVVLNFELAATTASTGLIYTSLHRAMNSGAMKALAIAKNHSFKTIYEHHELWLPPLG
jgi:hypothetical protein